MSLALVSLLIAGIPALRHSMFQASRNGSTISWVISTSCAISQFYFLVGDFPQLIESQIAVLYNALIVDVIKSPSTYTPKSDWVFASSFHKLGYHALAIFFGSSTADKNLLFFSHNFRLFCKHVVLYNNLIVPV